MEVVENYEDQEGEEQGYEYQEGEEEMMQENYQYQEGENENNDEENDLKESSEMNQNMQNGKGGIIQISEHNINLEDIVSSEDNNKKLKKYQKFVKNFEYKQSGNVNEDDKKEDGN